MTYNLNIDQEFAMDKGLTLVQVSALAALMTLPLWSECLTFEGVVWYQYSDEKMAEDFPLLFGVPKRCYKNVADLVSMGFVETMRFGGKKYVRFLGVCSEWNRQKSGNGPIVRKRTSSPKTDQKKSENGPEILILNNHNINTNTNDKKENNNIRDIIKEKRNPDEVFRAGLLDAGVTPEVADAFMLVRKKAKAVNSAIALKALLREAAAAGISVDEAVRFAVEWSWRGFRAEWYFNKIGGGARGRATGKGDVLSHNLAVLRNLAQQQPQGGEALYDEQ